MLARFKSVAVKIREQAWKINALRYSGSKFHCPVCDGRFSRLMPYKGGCHLHGEYVDHYTKNAVCPRCRSHIRHRFVLQFMRDRTDIFNEKNSIVHFAPEISFYKLFKKMKMQYITADLNPQRFEDAVYANLTDLPFHDSQFDYVICNHVLEHIVEDRIAMSEIVRIIKPGGHALLTVPTYGDETYEDMSLDYAARDREFGTGDHVRMYGVDFAARVREAGLAVDVVAIDDLPGSFVDRSVVSPHTQSDKYLFYCTKPATA